MTRALRFCPFLLILSLLATACGGDRHDSQQPAGGAPLSAPTARARLSTEPVLTETTGSVEPWRRVSPGTKLLGRITEAPVRVGDRVRSGQLLARLEREDLEAAVRQAEAALAMAEAEMDNAEAHFRRIVDLHERGSVTDKNLEDATAARRRGAAAVEQARANLSAAEVMLGYAEVPSPIDGWITAKHVEAGDMAAPGAPLFTVSDLSRVKIRLQVPETEVVGLERDAPVRVSVDALGRSWEATVDRINPSGDTASRTYRVELSLPNPEGDLKSGMFARAWLPRGEREVLRVPATAIVRRGQLEGLFVVGDDGVARLRWVRSGSHQDAGVEILSGLEAGETYVPDPPAGLTDGRRIEDGER